jgi:hypothetical protein
MSKRFTANNRKRFFLNESTTALKLLDLLLKHHFVLQDAPVPIHQRSVTNTVSKTFVLLLLRFLITHSNIPQDKLAHHYHVALQSLADFKPVSKSQQCVDDSNQPEKQEIIENVENVQAQSNLCQQQNTNMVTSPTIQQDQESPLNNTTTAQINKSQQQTTQSQQTPASNAFYCQTCSIQFGTVVQYRTHLRTVDLQKALRTRSYAAQSAPTEPPTPSNPQSQSLEDHQPSSISFAVQNEDKKESVQNTTNQSNQDKLQPGQIRYNYEEHTHDNGALDFKYAANLNDESDEDWHLDPKKHKNRQKRGSIGSRSNSRPRSGQGMCHNDDFDTRSVDSNQSRGSKSSQTSKTGKKQANRRTEDDSDCEINEHDDEYDDYDEKNGKNAVFQNLSTKSGTQIKFTCIPVDQDQVSTTQNQSNDPNQDQSEKGKKSQQNQQINNNDPVDFITTLQHHPQNLVLHSPSLGMLIIPASAASFNDLGVNSTNSDNFSSNSTAISNSTHNDQDPDQSQLSTTTLAPNQQNEQNSQFDPRQSPIIQSSLYHFFRLLSQVTPFKQSSFVPLNAIIMDSGGKFALSFFLGNVCIYHTSFANYTTRKKQGKQQSAYDKMGGKAQSIGSSIRRQQADRHKERIKEVLYHLRGELQCCQQILLYVPSIHMREQLFMNKEQLSKWNQSGGCWIGNSSTALEQHNSIQKSNIMQQQRLQSGFHHQFGDFDNSELELNAESSDSDQDTDNHQQQSQTKVNKHKQQQLDLENEEKEFNNVNYQPNYALLATQRDNYEGNGGDQFPTTSIPLTVPKEMPNWGFYLREKYSTAFNHINSNHRSTIDNNTGDYQILYFHRLNKKNAKNQQKLQILNKNDVLDDDVDDSDIAHVDHSITADWHKDTLMYHLNNNSTSTVNTENSNSNFNNSQQSFDHIMYVDQFLPNTPSGGLNLNLGRFEASSYVTHPPQLNSPIQIPSNTLQTHKMQQYDLKLSSFLQPKNLLTTTPSFYTIKPYHQHFYKANFTQQHEHLYLLHPQDPRITTLGLSIHDAKHHEILRVFQQLMLCKIKPQPLEPQ